MKALIVTEGGRDVGFGHVMRCVALSQAFEEKGISPELIINGDETIGDLLKETEHRVFNWLKDENELLACIKKADTIIIDSYLAGLDVYEKIAEAVEWPVYIDDNKRLDFPRGVVVNGSIFAERLGYPEKNGVDHLLGTRYALLRRMFWNIPEKPITDGVSKVLLTFGGNDKRNIAPKVLRMLGENYPHIIKNVVVGKAYLNQDQIRKAADMNTNLIYSPDSQKMADLVYESDIAITAAGQSLYELARTGSAVVAVAIADNQLNNARGWREAGFIEYAGWWEDEDMFSNLLNGLKALSDRAIRESRSDIGRRYVDGQGARRVVELILRPNRSCV